MVLQPEQAAAAAFLNNVMGKLFQALGLVETYRMLRDLEPESESLLHDLRMLAAAVDDELNASRGARRTAVTRAYSAEMRALTHDIEDCVERFAHRVSGVSGSGHDSSTASRLRRAARSVTMLRTCYRFVAEIKRLKKRVEEVRARVLKPLDAAAASSGGQPFRSKCVAGQRDANHTARRPVGIEGPMAELLGLLDLKGQPQPPTPVRVIAIFGFGGVGKTTLARAVYEDAAVASAFPCRVWVAVHSPENGDAAGIMESIHHQLFPKQQYSESLLTKYLKDKRYYCCFHIFC
ncbi:unnamed protein product [Urochloa humidicola]